MAQGTLLSTLKWPVWEKDLNKSDVRITGSGRRLEQQRRALGPFLPLLLSHAQLQSIAHRPPARAVGWPVSPIVITAVLPSCSSAATGVMLVPRRLRVWPLAASPGPFCFRAEMCALFSTVLKAPLIGSLSLKVGLGKRFVIWGFGEWSLATVAPLLVRMPSSH